MQERTRSCLRHNARPELPIHVFRFVLFKKILTIRIHFGALDNGVCGETRKGLLGNITVYGYFSVNEACKASFGTRSHQY